MLREGVGSGAQTLLNSTHFPPYPLYLRLSRVQAPNSVFSVGFQVGGLVEWIDIYKWEKKKSHNYVLDLECDLLGEFPQEVIAGVIPFFW